LTLFFDLWGVPMTRDKTLTLRLKILYYIKKGLYGNQIARKLNISKQLVNYHLKYLESKGYIKSEYRTSFKAYSITDSGLKYLESQKSKLRSKKISLGMNDKAQAKKPVSLHNFVVKYPILREQNIPFNWDKEVSLNGWIQKFYKLDKYPIEITIKKTTKHIIAYFKQLETNKDMFFTDFMNYALKGAYYVYYFLMKEAGIEIDIFNGEVISQHIANIEEDLNDKVDHKATFKVMLNRKSKSIYNTNIDASAWIDRSYGDVEIETNDLLYEEKLLLMPERVDRLYNEFLPAIERLTAQINLHLEVQREMLRTLKMIQKNLKGD